MPVWTRKKERGQGPPSRPENIAKVLVVSQENFQVRKVAPCPRSSCVEL